MWRMGLIVSMLLLGGATCAYEPCDNYVDYMCACHGDDPGFDCQELRRVYADADPELQDQCAIDLAEQKDEDEAVGLECSADTGF